MIDFQTEVEAAFEKHKWLHVRADDLLNAIAANLSEQGRNVPDLIQFYREWVKEGMRGFSMVRLHKTGIMRNIPTGMVEERPRI